MKITKLALHSVTKPAISDFSKVLHDTMRTRNPPSATTTTGPNTGQISSTSGNAGQPPECVAPAGFFSDGNRLSLFNGSPLTLISWQTVPAPEDDAAADEQAATDATVPAPADDAAADAQAANDASSIYYATHDGLTGLGTQEDVVWGILDHKTPEEIDRIRKAYRRDFHGDLDETLRNETSGRSRERVDALLRGDQATADAISIESNIFWANPTSSNEHDSLSTLEDATPEERHQIAEAFAVMQGGRGTQTAEQLMLAELDKVLNAAEMDLAESLLGEYSAQTADERATLNVHADAARLRLAVQRWGTDEDAIKAILADKSPEEIAAIAKAYEEEYGEKLAERLDSEASGDAERAVFQRLLNPATDNDTQSGIDASVERLRLAVDGAGTDEAAIEAELRGKSQAEIDSIIAAYQLKYGEGLAERLREEASGQGESDVWMRMLTPGANYESTQAMAAAERIHRAMEGYGTDEDATLNELGDKSKADIEAIAAAYKEKYGEDLRDRIKRETGGRVETELLTLFDEGAIDPNDPNATQMQIDRQQAFHDEEQGPGLKLTSFIQDLFMDQSAQELFEEHQEQAQTALNAGDTATAQRSVGVATADLHAEQEAKHAAAECVAEGAAVVASVAVIVATATTATPVVAAGWAAAASAVASGGTYWLVEGNSADIADVAVHATLGAVTGATAMVGGSQLAGVVSRGVARATTRDVAANVVTETAAQTSGRFMALRYIAESARKAVVDSAPAAAVQGSAYSAVDTASQRETWEDGVFVGLGRVAICAAEGGFASVALSIPFALSISVSLEISLHGNIRRINPEFMGNSELVADLRQNRKAARLASREPVRVVFASRWTVLQSFAKSRRATDALAKEMKSKAAHDKTELYFPKVSREARDISEAAQRVTNENRKRFTDDTPAHPGWDPTSSELTQEDYLKDYLDDLYGAAETASIELKAITRKIAAQTRGEAHFREKPKDRMRAEDKINSKYGGNASLLTDLAGSKISYDSIDNVYAALKIIIESKELKLVAMKDRILKPQDSGYGDILLNLQMGNDHIAEFRLHLRQVDAVSDEVDHQFYELNRSFEPVAKDNKVEVDKRAIDLKERLENTSRQLYARAFKEAELGN